ncbi:hypothetical protein NIIg32_gp67 [Parageobacillus phage vB_PtoS_NIIg3.2]|nr:hypothetical protein NIIg32_gp67 [Parageobacillus phage vB_PtoS_NIIg3.2]
MSNEELGQILKKELQRIGSASLEAYDSKRSKGMPSSVTIKRRFEMNWTEVLKFIGIDENDIKRRFRSRESIIQAVSELAQKLGRAPTLSECEKVHVNRKAIYTYFNDFSELLHEAGINKTFNIQEVPESNEQLLDMYRQFSKKLGRPARIRDLNESDEIYDFDVFKSRFGSLYDLQRLAGFDVKQDRRKIFKQDVENVMIEIYRKYGRVSYKKLCELLPFSYRTVLRRYNTTSINDVWNEIIKKASDRKLKEK